MGLLSLIPCLIERLVAGWWLVVGVAGWNTILLVRTRERRKRFGTLLGPEGTPVRVGCFLVPLLAWPA